MSKQMSAMRNSLMIAGAVLALSMTHAALAQTGPGGSMNRDEQKAVQIVRAWTIAFGNQDADKVVSYMADNVEFRGDPDDPTFTRGRAAALKTFKTIFGHDMKPPAGAPAMQAAPAGAPPGAMMKAAPSGAPPGAMKAMPPGTMSAGAPPGAPPGAMRALPSGAPAMSAGMPMMHIERGPVKIQQIYAVGGPEEVVVIEHRIDQFKVGDKVNLVPVGVFFRVDPKAGKILEWLDVSLIKLDMKPPAGSPPPGSIPPGAPPAGSYNFPQVHQ